MPAARIICLGCCVVSWQAAAAAGDAAVSLENSHIRVTVTGGDGGPAKREFFAKSAAGWDLVLSSFAPSYAGAGDAAPRLWDTAQNRFRHLITGLPARVRKDVAAGEIELRMEHEGAVIREKLRLGKDDDFVHVSVDAELPGSPVKLDFLLSAYTFHHDGAPAFVHTPGVKFDDPRAGNGRDQITGDRSFHAPAVILQEGGLFAALVPDLPAINAKQVVSPDARRQMKIGTGPFSLPVEAARYTMPAGLDLNVKPGLTREPVLTFGLMDAVIGHHIRYTRDERGETMVRTLARATAGYEFDLFVAASAPAGCGYQRVASHQWQRSGHSVFTAQPHLAMPMAEYIRLVSSTVFSPIRTADGKLVSTPAGVMDPPLPGYEDQGSWLEWEADGKALGGFRCAAPFWNDVIHNSPFWNGARDAAGMVFWGRELGDTRLIGQARRIVNFCLSAPRNEHGLFSTVYSAVTRTWGRSWTNPVSGERRLFLRDSPCYEVAALCKTGAHLLDYHLRAEPDARIVPWLRPFAEWLVGAMDERGTIPSFVTADMESSPILKDSAQSAVGMWFLAEMFNATREEKFRAAAVRIAGFLEREIIPTARWIDFEQYLSCGAKPFTFVRDEWQGQWFRGNLSVIWAAEGFAALHRADGADRWLTDGGRCVDYLSFTQCVWRPHYIYTANPFGGFGVDNGDSAPMLDQRQAETVRPFIYFGKHLGRQDLIERAVAAARSGCVLIVHPRHVQNGIFPHPMFYPVGLSPENIDHEAHPQCPMRTHPCWGEGSAVFTGLAEARRELGGLYVDAEHRIAVGVDGVSVTAAEFSGQTALLKVESRLSAPGLKQPWEEPFTVRVTAPSTNVLIGGEDLKASKTLRAEKDGTVKPSD